MNLSPLVSTYGRHLLVDYVGCDSSILNDIQQIEKIMLEAAKAACTHVVGSIFHPFQPTGVSGVVVIEESHLSIHTWPDINGYASVDLYTCGQGDPYEAHKVLLKELKATDFNIQMIERGIFKSNKGVL